jgi:transcription elongation GreA/GreB family factor
VPVKLSHKHELISALVGQIDEELVAMTRIAKEAAEAAAHEENRAEGNKDMRSTEASYIARGQAERALELERHRTRLVSLDLKELSSSSSIEAGAVIEVMHEGKRQTYLMLPVAGGRRATVGTVTVSTITPTSPLGSALLGLNEGDEAEVEANGRNKTYEVLSVR